MIVTGDHGWSLGEQGTWTKHTNFEASVRVPLLIRVPGINEGKYSDVLVEQLDMFPTLVDLAGIGFDKLQLPVLARHHSGHLHCVGYNTNDDNK